MQRDDRPVRRRDAARDEHITGHVLAGLIAPRPLLVEAGTEDGDFPVAGTRRAVAELRRVYDCLGAGAALETDIFAGGHRWSGARAYDWLAKELA